MILPNTLYFAHVEQLLAEGKQVQIRVKGNSMRPLLRSERDIVELIAVSTMPLQSKAVSTPTPTPTPTPTSTSTSTTSSPSTSSTDWVRGKKSLPRSIDTLRVGDIVLFRCAGQHRLHRITKWDGDRLTFAGDGNYLICEQGIATDIIAIAHRVIRSSGKSIACNSWSWRAQSRLWLALPPLVRRLLLSVLWRIGWR